MEERKLIQDEIAGVFPFLYQTIKIKEGGTQHFNDMTDMEICVSAIQNRKAQLANFYKCISRF